jgi:hypothetical protein
MNHLLLSLASKIHWQSDEICDQQKEHDGLPIEITGVF